MAEQKSVVITTDSGVSRIETTAESATVIETEARQGPPGPPGPPGDNSLAWATTQW